MLKAVMRYELHHLAGQICQINARSLLGGEKQSDRRKAKTQELNRAARSAPTVTAAKQSAHCLRQTPPSSALCRPHSHLIHRPPFIQNYEEHILLLVTPETQNGDHFKEKLRCDSIRPLNGTNTHLKMTSEYIKYTKILKMRPHKHTQNHTEGHRSQEAASDR